MYSFGSFARSSAALATMRLWRAGLAWRLVCCDRGRGAMHGSVDDGTKRIDNDNRSEDVGSSRGDGLGEELTATRAGAPRVMRPV